jgi:hypothetical protein
MFVEIALKKETPFFQVIDFPVLPLKKKVLTPLKGSIFGFLFGLLLSVSLLIAWYALNSQKTQTGHLS